MRCFLCFLLLQTLSAVVPELNHLLDTGRVHPEEAYLVLVRLAGSLSCFSAEMEPLVLPKPDGVENVLIDPESGLRADASCSGARELPFAQGSAPSAAAPCASQVGVAVEVVKERAKTFFERLFGR